MFVVCLFVYLFVCVKVCVFACVFVYVFVCLFVGVGFMCVFACSFGIVPPRKHEAGGCMKQGLLWLRSCILAYLIN